MFRAAFLFFVLFPLTPIHARDDDPKTISGSLNWILVDTMNNCYGMLSNAVSPLDYDPVTG